MNTFFTKPYNNALATLVLCCTAVALGSYAYFTLKQAGEGTVTNPTISVDGTGEVSAIPDVATFSFSVQADGIDATTAQTASAKSVNAIIDFLKSQNIDTKDIKTSDYSLYPKYKYETQPCFANGLCPSGNQVADGYSVTETITVKVRATDTAGTILSGVGDHGATNISSLSLIIDKPDTLNAAARQIAIADAQAKARQLASDLGVHLGRLVGFNENQNFPQPYYSMAKLGAGMAEDAALPPAIPTGENKITSNVSLTYELK